MNVANKKFGIILLLVILALLSLLILAMSEEVSHEDDVQNFTQIEEYFIDQITAKTLDRSDGQPIDGLEASMYIDAFPGLQGSDFTNVETFGDGDQASADAVVTNQGLVRLLENVADRLGLSVESEEDIDALLVTISREQPVGDVTNDIDATSTASVSVRSELADSCEAAGGNWLTEHNECEYVSNQWCTEAEGNFKECASACRNSDAVEPCVPVCVPLCQFE